MSSLQALKDAISRIRKISSDFAEWDTSPFPAEKLGNGILDAETGCILLERLVETVEIALEDEQACIENVSPAEMAYASGALEGAAQTLQNQNPKFVKLVEELLVPVRPFGMLPMVQAREASSFLKKQARAMKDSIDRHSSLLEGMDKKIAAQEAATDEYKTKLAELSATAEAAETARDEERKKELAEFSANCASSMKNAQKLIDSAKEALHLATAYELGAAFMAKEAKSGDRQVKWAWLSLGLVAVVVAIYLGLWLLIQELSVASVLARSLVMFVVIGVALFAGNQFAKNKAIEEDYAYKAALVNSYPGFANKIGDDDSRKEYTRKLLAEILQDPQRVRKVEKKHLLLRNPLFGSDKNESSDG